MDEDVLSSVLASNEFDLELAAESVAQEIKRADDKEHAFKPAVKTIEYEDEPSGHSLSPGCSSARASSGHVSHVEALQDIRWPGFFGALFAENQQRAEKEPTMVTCTLAAIDDIDIMPFVATKAPESSNNSDDDLEDEDEQTFYFQTSALLFHKQRESIS